MKTVRVLLPTTQSVQSFVDALIGLNGDFEFVDGRVMLDARSLMGVFSLDLSKPLQLRVHQPTEANLSAIRPFIVPGEETEHA